MKRVSMSGVKVKLKTLAKNAFEIYGVINGKFVKKQYIGYSKEQAVKKFTGAVRKGEI